MFNREQIRKNCGSMGTEGDFGREKRNPPGRPSLLGKCFSDSEAERVPVFPSNRRIQQDVLCQPSVLSNTLAENTPTPWTTPRATLCMVYSTDYLMAYPIASRGKTIRTSTYTYKQKSTCVHNHHRSPSWFLQLGLPRCKSVARFLRFRGVCYSLKFMIYHLVLFSLLSVRHAFKGLVSAGEDKVIQWFLHRGKPSS